MPIPLITMMVVLMLVTITAVGDFYIKTATGLSNPFLTWQFSIGFVTYALGAFGWFYAMKYMPLAETAVVYSCLTIIVLTLLGVFVFHESLSLREFLGVTLAISAVLVMYDWRPVVTYVAKFQ